tara:strand:- start:1504 stop:1659 length:156 start_codon:yes stop_codon:yes gene_type:complete
MPYLGVILLILACLLRVKRGKYHPKNAIMDLWQTPGSIKPGLEIDLAYAID